jgi:SHS2 domain-containing protein
VVCRRIQLQKIDRENWKVKGVALGERFVDGVHEQGTEIKAITYSAMQIVEKGRGGTETPGGGHDAELFVIVDI